MEDDSELNLHLYCCKQCDSFSLSFGDTLKHIEQMGHSGQHLPSNSHQHQILLKVPHLNSCGKYLVDLQNYPRFLRHSEKCNEPNFGLVADATPFNRLNDYTNSAKNTHEIATEMAIVLNNLQNKVANLGQYVVKLSNAHLVEIPKYRCDSCDKDFGTNKKMLKNHIKSKHFENEVRKQESSVRCKKCKQSFYTEYAFDLHTCRGFKK